MRACVRACICVCVCVYVYACMLVFWYLRMSSLSIKHCRIDSMVNEMNRHYRVTDYMHIHLLIYTCFTYTANDLIDPITYA